MNALLALLVSLYHIKCIMCITCITCITSNTCITRITWFTVDLKSMGNLLKKVNLCQSCKFMNSIYTSASKVKWKTQANTNYCVNHPRYTLPQEHIFTFPSLGWGSHTQLHTRNHQKPWKKSFELEISTLVWRVAPPLPWIGALSALKTATLNTLRARLEHTLPIASVDTTSLRTLLPIIRSHKPADDIIKIFIFMGSSIFLFNTIKRFGNEIESS